MYAISSFDAYRLAPNQFQHHAATKYIPKQKSHNLWTAWPSSLSSAAVPKKINLILESRNLPWKLNENMINIEYFSLLILIETYSGHAAFCSTSWSDDSQTCVTDSLCRRYIHYYVLSFTFRLFLEQHVQLHSRKTPRLRLGILVKKGNYEINSSTLRTKNNIT